MMRHGGNCGDDLTKIDKSSVFIFFLTRVLKSDTRVSCEATVGLPNYWTVLKRDLLFLVGHNLTNRKSSYKFSNTDIDLRETQSQKSVSTCHSEEKKS
jgi:hypothetical protein